MLCYEKKSEAMKHFSLCLFLLICNAPAFAQMQLKHYINPRARISFQYDKSLILQKNFTANYFYPAKGWRYSPMENNESTGQQIVSINLANLENIKIYPKQDGKGYYNAQINIGASADKNELKKCYAKNDAIEIINGHTFHVQDNHEAGMSQRFYLKSYRTIYQKKCYALEYMITYVAEVDSEKMNKKYHIDNNAKVIFHSFKFIE